MSLPTPLPTLCGFFQRLFQRLFQLSANAYQPPFQPCVSNPSYSPCGWKHRFWALGPAVLPPREGKEGGVEKDLISPNTQITFTPVIAWLGISRCRATWLPRYRADVGSELGSKRLTSGDQRERDQALGAALAPVLSFGARARIAKSNPDFLMSYRNRPEEGCRWGRQRTFAQEFTSCFTHAAPFQKPVATLQHRPGCLFRRGSAQKFPDRWPWRLVKKAAASPENIQMTMNDSALIGTQASESNEPTIASDLRRNET
jgi:hypothetical protein